MNVDFTLDDDTFPFYASMDADALTEEDVSRLSGGTLVFQKEDKLIEADVAIVEWIVELAGLCLEDFVLSRSGEQTIADIEGTVMSIAWKDGKVTITGWNDVQPKIVVNMTEFEAAVRCATRRLREVFDRFFPRKELIAKLIEFDERFGPIDG